MTGRTISHYRILERLGEGGMGRVYRARDTRLDRVVALKFLDRQVFTEIEEKARFIREAQLGAALDHPNICTIYEVDEVDDEVFIAMAYVDGTTLRERLNHSPLPVQDIIDVALQASAGILAAHRSGIIHRDIKSSNILIAEHGQVQITDFGVATTANGAEVSDGVEAVGSVAYMSPEQARGETVDERTDIWSLGVVIYEMLAGRPPFPADYAAAALYRVVNEEPDPISDLRADVPVGLQRIVERMLAKDRDDRYRSIEDVISDLLIVSRRADAKQTSVSGVPDPSIAILPMTDLSPKKDQEYFCDGLSEEITNALAAVEGVRVVARTSAFSFKGKDVDVRQIGGMLDVGHVVQGSVQLSGEKLRVSVSLTNSETGFELWSERYDRPFGDVFSIQDEITLAIVDKLRVTLLADDRKSLVKRHTDSPDAFSLYWNGRHFWNKRTEEGYRKALSYFEAAIELDPLYALSYVGVADCYDLLGWYDYLPPDDAFSRAREAAQRAMALDEGLAEAHATAGWICANYDRAWECAEREYRRALSLNPGYATAHQWYAEFLSYMGRHEEARRHARQARTLDPLSIIINADLGQVLYYARDYVAAVDRFQDAIQMDPGFAVAHYFLAFAYMAQGRYDAALAAANRLIELSGSDDPMAVAQLATVCAFAGHDTRTADALTQLHGLAEQRYVSPFCMALVHVGTGCLDDAFDWLERAISDQDHWVETLAVHPALDRIRGDRRYRAMLARLGLERMAAHG